MKLRFKSTKTIVLEELELQINKCLDENSVDRIYIGKVLEDLYVTFIYYCKIDLNYHNKINNLQIGLDREVEIIKLTDPYWNTAHKLLINNE